MYNRDLLSTLLYHLYAYSYRTADSQAQTDVHYILPPGEVHAEHHDGVAHGQRLQVRSVPYLTREMALTSDCSAFLRLLQFTLQISLHIRDVIYDLHTSTLLVDLVILQILVRFELLGRHWRVNADVQNLYK